FSCVTSAPVSTGPPGPCGAAADPPPTASSFRGAVLYHRTPTPAHVIASRPHSTHGSHDPPPAPAAFPVPSWLSSRSCCTRSASSPLADGRDSVGVGVAISALTPGTAGVGELFLTSPLEGEVAGAGFGSGGW